MTIQYEWVIGPFDVRLEADGLPKVIYGVHWRLVGTEDGFQASVYGSLGLPPPESEHFTPFEELTKEMVIKWVEYYLGADKIAELKIALANDIDRQRNPVDVTIQPPWSE